MRPKPKPKSKPVAPPTPPAIKLDGVILCPFCHGSIGPRDGVVGTVLHSTPHCETFEILNTSTFLQAVERKRGKV